MVGVTGSIPVAPTTFSKSISELGRAVSARRCDCCAGEAAGKRPAATRDRDVLLLSRPALAGWTHRAPCAQHRDRFVRRAGHFVQWFMQRQTLNERYEIKSDRPRTTKMIELDIETQITDGRVTDLGIMENFAAP